MIIMDRLTRASLHNQPKMYDKDKKVVNTEEENRAVNPGDSDIPEDSISQEAAHTVNTDTSSSESGSTPAEQSKSNTVNPTGEDDSKRRHVEGDRLDLDKTFAEE